METKYRVTFTRNDTCPFEFDRCTNVLIVAIWHLLIVSIKYPIVDFQIRRGYVECEKCDADWCDESAAWKEPKNEVD